MLLILLNITQNSPSEEKGKREILWEEKEYTEDLFIHSLLKNLARNINTVRADDDDLATCTKRKDLLRSDPS